ncbi:alpha/beta hydrolase family protein [Legionella sp. 16cNR16C]|uniref:alpha/beta hydrolase family protein n=1 Tax=Legionella sp. 16cNR16C TaxID=2905656 RepID=UPI001E5693EE|nr:alpha/beta hydrolase family protein [Legionella sp. 16cNR16C]MCE3045833.1 alpha/beta hydrolase family protein [Legionella sp. 16cNR16C]
MHSRLILIILLFLFQPQAVLADDHIKINVNQEEIELPFWEARQKETKGGIILLQGGKPAGGAEFSRKLADSLAKAGWSVTLLNSDLRVKTPWIEQLPEAMSTLRQRNSNRLIMIHYGDELDLSLNYFSKPQSKQVNGLVLLSAFQSKPDEKTTRETLGKGLRFPVYEIYAQFDYEAVKHSAQQLKLQLKKAGSRSFQVPGSSHDYYYSTDLLKNYLNGWMSRLNPTERAKLPL